jgi:type IV pilus assembly protein PilE
MEKPMKNQQGKKQHGFTLLELMIVLVIVAIISAIAIPAYQDYTIRSKIPMATSILSNTQVALEQWYQDNRTYAGGPCSPAANDYFTFSCPSSGTTGNGTAYPSPNPSSTGYMILATGKGNMAGFDFVAGLDSTKGSWKESWISSTSHPNWNASQSNCWITNKGGKC